jgi:hypothetical protein
MNRKLKGDHYFDASDASKISAAEKMTSFLPVSPAQTVSLLGPISTAC